MCSNTAFILSILTLCFLQLATTSPYGMWLSPTEMANGGPELTRVKRQPAPEESSRVTWIIDTEGGSSKNGPLVDLTSLNNGQKSAGKKENDKSNSKNEAGSSPGTSSDGGDGKTTPKPNSATTSASVGKEQEKSGSEPKDTKETVILIDSEVDKVDSKTAAKPSINDVVETFFNKCLRVRCTAAPAGVECKEFVGVNPSQLNGLTNDCCPVHTCRREDGSTFFHYAIELDEEPGVNNPTARPPTQQTPFLNNGNSGLPLPPPHPASLPPFISSFLPPIFPFFPPPSTFYNNGVPSRQGAPSGPQFGSQSASIGSLFVPPLSSGTFHQTTASFPSQIVFPPGQNFNGKQLPPNQQQTQLRKNGADSSVTTLDRFVRNIGVAPSSGAAPGTRFDAIYTSSGPFAVEEGFRARRNAVPFASEVGQFGLMSNRQGGGFGGFQFN